MAEPSNKFIVFQIISLVMLIAAASITFWKSASNTETNDDQALRLLIGDEFMQWTMEQQLSGGRFTWEDSLRLIEENGLKPIEEVEREFNPPKSLLDYFEKKRSQEEK